MKMKSSLVLIILLASQVTVFGQIGYIQELHLYQDVPEYADDSIHAFHQHVPDLTVCFRNLTRICAKGFWMAYLYTQFEGHMTGFHGNNNEFTCFDHGSYFPFKSIRHTVFANTSIPALSMYPQEGFQGLETLVTEDEGLLVFGKSFAYSAHYEWHLFEEHNFEGKSVCTTVNPSCAGLGICAHTNVTESFDLKQVGSVIKGCFKPPQAILLN